jgi:hypothetical protein
MFCPRCAAQNAENASFCRSCGANISLVPQALTGQLAEQLVAAEEDAPEGGGRRRRRGKKEKKPATVESAVKSIFIGIGFICVSLAILRFMPGGFVWWFWMLIPAFACLGDGVGTLFRVRSERQLLAPPPFRPASIPAPPSARAAELPPRDSSGFYTPTAVPSVTEGTTRHLGAPVERPPKDV